MKWVLSLLLIAGLWWGLPAMAVEQPLNIVTLDQPPLGYEVNGELKGITADIVKAVFSRMKMPVTIKVYPFSRCLYLMENGLADMLFAVVKTPDRQRFMIYPEEILLAQKAVLFVRSDSGISFHGDLSRLSHLKFGVLRGATYGKQWKQAVDNEVISKVSPVSEYRQNIFKLINHRVDVIIGPRFTMLHLLKEHNLTGQIKELTPAIESVPTYLTFSKKNISPELAEQVNQTIRTMKREGVIDNIVDAYVAKLTGNSAMMNLRNLCESGDKMNHSQKQACQFFWLNH